MTFVPARLKADRERAMLSLRELSERSGVARDNLANIEKGKTKRPHPSTLRRLAEALGVTGERWFIDEETE